LSISCNCSLVTDKLCSSELFVFPSEFSFSSFSEIDVISSPTTTSKAVVKYLENVS
jgi:uncharacterized protein with FMN-binding domain